MVLEWAEFGQGKILDPKFLAKNRQPARAHISTGMSHISTVQETENSEAPVFPKERHNMLEIPPGIRPLVLLGG